MALKFRFSFLLHLLCADCSSGVRSVIVAFVSIVVSPGRDENPYSAELRTCLFLEKISSRRSWVELRETAFDLISLCFGEVRVKAFLTLSQHTSVFSDQIFTLLLLYARAHTRPAQRMNDTASWIGFISECLWSCRARRCSLRTALCQYMRFHTIKLERTCVLELCHLYQDWHPTLVSTLLSKVTRLTCI